MSDEQHAIDPYNMRAADWRDVAIFLANAVVHLSPSKADEFLTLAEGMNAEWSWGGHFRDPWDLDRLMDGEDSEVDRRARHLLPRGIYQALGVEFSEHVGEHSA